MVSFCDQGSSKQAAGQAAYMRRLLEGMCMMSRVGTYFWSDKKEYESVEIAPPNKVAAKNVEAGQRMASELRVAVTKCFQ